MILDKDHISLISIEPSTSPKPHLFCDPWPRNLVRFLWNTRRNHQESRLKLTFVPLWIKCNKVRQWDSVYQDLIFTQALGVCLIKTQREVHHNHKPLALQPPGKTVRCETPSMEQSLPLLIGISPLPQLSKPKAYKGYHNTIRSTSEITAKFTATTNDLKVRKKINIKRNHKTQRKHQKHLWTKLTLKLT